MIQPVTYLIPLRYYLVIVRGIFLKGVGLEAFWRDALLMLGMGRGGAGAGDDAVEEDAGLGESYRPAAACPQRFRHLDVAAAGRVPPDDRQELALGIDWFQPARRE